MTTDSWALAAITLFLLLALYTYVGYPLLLLAVGALRRRGAGEPPEPAEWPRVSITVPAYNEEHEIADTLEALLRIDYPADRRQIVVVSDASTDGTDRIVRSFAGRGVELLRLPRRSGKTVAENTAAAHLTGDVVVNTDASVRIAPDALKPLVRALAEPGTGLASGRDVSVARLDRAANPGESGYVGYEMAVRRLETRAGGIVGASGCFYAIRAELHRKPLPEALSRDFAAALVAREHGWRAVSVDRAVCLVPRTASPRREYRRKVRTITRGMETLAFKRHLLNPLRFGLFAWKLWSHKVCRWLVPWTALLAFAATLVLAPGHPWARLVAAAGGLVLAAAAVAAAWPAGRRIPRVVSLPAFAALGNLAAVHASLRAAHGDQNATWEPTRREASGTV